MAPDLNSLPASPHQLRSPTSLPSSQNSSNVVSRRTSQQMPPPPQPSAPPVQQSSGASLFGGHVYPHRSPIMTGSDQPEVPLRHPRPMTAAEVYAECEKEQEAVVNRLTRELSALRAQAASVASNASQSSNSTSASLLPVDISDPNPTHQITGATHPTPSRRHRSSSSLSTPSVSNTSATAASVATSGLTNASTQTQSGSTINVPVGGLSQASADRAAAAAGQHSRRPSANASGASTPARLSIDISRHGVGSTLPHRPSPSRDPSYASQVSTAAQAGTPYPLPLPSPAAQSPVLSQQPQQHQTLGLASPQLGESAAASTTLPQRSSTNNTGNSSGNNNEVDILKAENEALRTRVRALERALRSRRSRRDSSTSDTARGATGTTMATAAGPADVTRIASPEIPPLRPMIHGPAGVAAWAAGDGGVGGVAGPRERSESQSTTASSRRGMQGEDEVRLGESAGSVGIGRGV